MARPLRIQFPGALYHITSRGDRKEDIFHDRHDRMIFLEIFESIIFRYNWLCHAFCLMNNHYHLLIETLDANLSEGMRQLNGIYTQKHNIIHQTVGHVFQGRYKSILIEKESHLLTLCRYIVLNPVRANLVKDPKEWEWSSYHVTSGISSKFRFISTDWILSQFDKANKINAQEFYKQFILEGIGQESPLSRDRKSVILGSAKFINKMSKYLKEKVKIKEIIREERFISRPALSLQFNDSMTKKERDMQIYIAHINYGYRLNEIADYLQLHYSTVSRLFKQVLLHKKS